MCHHITSHTHCPTFMCTKTPSSLLGWRVIIWAILHTHYTRKMAGWGVFARGQPSPPNSYGTSPQTGLSFYLFLFRKRVEKRKNCTRRPFSRLLEKNTEKYGELSVFASSSSWPFLPPPPFSCGGNGKYTYEAEKRKKCEEILFK